MSIEWVDSPERARFEARTQSRSAGAPPHWLRCEYFREGERCVRGEGHSGEHEPRKVLA